MRQLLGNLDNKDTDGSNIVHVNLSNVGKLNASNNHKERILGKIRKGFIIAAFCCAAILGGCGAALSITSSFGHYRGANMESALKLLNHFIPKNGSANNDALP